MTKGKIIASVYGFPPEYSKEMYEMKFKPLQLVKVLYSGKIAGELVEVQAPRVIESVSAHVDLSGEVKYIYGVVLQDQLYRTHNTEHVAEDRIVAVLKDYCLD